MIDSEGTLRLGTRLCVPDVDELRKEIMEEAHFSSYSIHPGSTKMYHDLKKYIWVEWNEERHCRFRVQMSHLSASEVGALETLWITAAVTYSRVEVRYDCHGFCKWFASHIKWL